MPIIFSDRSLSRHSSVDDVVRAHPAKDKPEIADDLDDFELFDLDGDMADPGTPAPFIKGEPDDLQYLGQHLPQNQGENFNVAQQYQQQMQGQQGDMGGVDPSDLNMTNSFFQNQFQPQNNMSSSFMMGNAGIGDDELLDLHQSNPQQGSFQQGQPSFDGQGGDAHQGRGSVQGYPNDGMRQAQMGQMYSHTPEGAPIQSPFVHGPNFNQFRQGMQSFPPQQMQQGFHNGSVDMNARPRPGVPQNRQTSDSRSPHTPALTGLQLSTPDTGSLPSQPIHAAQMGHHRQQRSIDTQWGGTPGSGGSYLDSPMASPSGQMHPPQISEVLKSGQHASMPAKMDPNAPSTSTAPSLQSQEAKRRRRRESHNMVERRRRDNINERIQDLASLVPTHRLEDDKVRKHLVNNAPLSPGVAATGLSPPQAKSMLAGNNGRRAAGNITQGLPMDDKDRGPNKGDILNGSVAWVRDLMWLAHFKLQQEDRLKELVSNLGGNWPFEEDENEKRMRTELLDAVQKNDPEDFSYSRYHGSGLRVPRHTNVAGDPLPMSPQSLSPAFTSGGSGSNSGGPANQQWSQFNNAGGQGHVTFKEEEEYHHMEM